MKESILIHQIVGWTRLQIAFEGSHSWVVESRSKEKLTWHSNMNPVGTSLHIPVKMPYNMQLYILFPTQ